MGFQPQHHRRLYILDTGLSQPQPRCGRILSCLTDGTDRQSVVDNITTMPGAITIDHENGHMYWTNMGRSFKKSCGFIERANLDGSERKVIIPPGSMGIFTPNQITIGRQSRKLYWCDREGMKVMRSNIDGSDVEVLVSAGDSEEDRSDQLRWCVGIAVDEPRGFFYWVQKGPSKGEQGRILRAPIEGPQGFFPDKRWDIEVVFDSLPEPVYLEMDTASQTLYWTDRGDPPNGNTLNRAAIGMGGVPQVLATRLHEAIGLGLDREDDVVYVADLAGGIYAIDIKTRAKKVLFPELGDLTGMALA